MRTLLNIIWVVFGGFWLALGYFVAGVIACIFIITIPAGIASFRMANYVLWPFGRSVTRRPEAGAGSAIMNVLWFIIAGWWLALAHVAAALAQTLTIIGIGLIGGSMAIDLSRVAVVTATPDRSSDPTATSRLSVGYPWGRLSRMIARSSVASSPAESARTPSHASHQGPDAPSSVGAAANSGSHAAILGVAGSSTSSCATMCVPGRRSAILGSPPSRPG